MASIPLRTYNREIERMVDGGQVEEAIAHCHHILQSIPKHLGTYRLLGKAHLENHHYGDAADVFLRVLSATPDDFVANVGMSIIREDEGNLDAAIWHMERAFEAQPSNRAIQEELRRLYGRRDGLEPPRVRLTRGALARMYAKGHLYDQAIGELRAALAEDPTRLDLLILLAQMYFMAGKRVEAVDTCSTILKKLPYCLYANRILAAILPATERAEDTKIYDQRVRSLDPYFVLAASRAFNSEAVPDQAVVVSRLEWKPGEAGTTVPAQPAWAASLGVAFQETAAETVPDWLAPTEEQAEPLAGEKAAVAEPTPEEALPTPEEEIPDWMKEAGWGPSTGLAEEPPPSLDTLETREGEIAAAEIPDWLKDMAPSGLLEGDTAETIETAPAEEIPWLQEKQPGASDTIATWLEETKPEVEGLPDQLPEVAAGSIAEIPEWLIEEKLEAEQTGLEAEITGVEEEAALTVEAEKEEAAEAGLPEWLTEAEQVAGAVVTGTEVEAIPEWLEEAPVEPLTDVIAPTSIPSIEEVPGVEVEPPKLEPPAEGVPATEAPYSQAQEEQDAGLAWLEGLAAKQGAAEEELITKPEERLETPPAWAAEVSSEAETLAPVPGEEALIEPAITEEDNLLDWLTAPDTESPPTLEQAAPLETAIEPALPEWLQEIAPESKTTETAPLAEAPAQSIPEEQDAGLAWLENLAAKQGAAEEELITRPEDRLERPPEWVAEIPAEAETATAVEAELPKEEVPLPGGDLPEWLFEAPAEATIVAEKINEEELPVSPQAEVAPLESFGETVVQADTGEIPGWAKETFAESPAAEKVTTTSEAGGLPAMPDLTDQDAALAWLESLAAKQGAAEEELITKPEDRLEKPPEWVLETPETKIPAAEVQFPEEEGLQEKASESAVMETMPDWLREAVTEEPPAIVAPEETTEAAATIEPIETPVEAAPDQPAIELPSTSDLTDQDSALAWLESLAVKQGAVEEELFSRPEERPETPPAWVEEIKEESPAVIVESSEEVAATEEPFAEAGVGVAADEITGEAIPTETPAVFETPPELPDWLKDIVESGTPQGELASTGVTGWLEGREGVAPSAAELAPEAPQKPPATPAPDLPAWLTEAISEPQVAPQPVRQIDLNEASLADLESLPGVGFRLASRILNHRETQGPFRSLEDLSQVSGISPELAQELGQYLSIRKPSVPAHEAVTARLPVEGIDPDLAAARTALASGDDMSASEHYHNLLKQGKHLDDVIADLRHAVEIHPKESALWQTLGDAYLRADRLSEALEAYSKAEELLR